MAGGGGGKPPEKSQAEKDLQAFQLEMLKDQRSLFSEQLRVQDLLAPFLYESAGIKPRYENGKIVGFDQVKDDLTDQRKRIEKGLLDRSEKALAGTLDVDPGLERGIAKNQSTLEATLAQQLGPGYATSTPGIQALAESSRYGEELRASARRGELTLAEGLGLNREQANRIATQQQMANLGSVFQVPGAGQGGSVQSLNSLAQILQGYQNDRQMAFTQMPLSKNRYVGAASGAATGALSGALIGSSFPVIGTAAGAIGGGLFGALGGYFM